MATNVEWPDEDEPLEISFEGKKFHTGYSRISKYQACPRQYKYVYVDKRRGIATTPMRRGSAYHGALEDALNSKLLLGKRMRLSKLIESATAHGVENELPEKVIEEVRGACRLWHATYYDAMDPLFVEGKFTITRHGVTMTGIVDAGVRTVKLKGGVLTYCDKRGRAVDHKLSFDLWTDHRAKESVQPMIYQWAWEDVFGPQTGLSYQHFEYHILKTFPVFGAETLTMGRVSAEGSAWMAQNVREIAEGMCKGVYFARPSLSECGRCPFKQTECKPELYRVSRRQFGEYQDD